MIEFKFVYSVRKEQEKSLFDMVSDRIEQRSNTRACFPSFSRAELTSFSAASTAVSHEAHTTSRAICCAVVSCCVALWRGERERGDTAVRKGD